MDVRSLARVLALLVTVSACDDKTDAGKADAKDAKAGTTKAAGEPGKKSGAIVDVTMTSGQQLLQATPSECVLDAEGKGKVVADGGNFVFEAHGRDGRLVWKHPAGDLDMTALIMAKGDGWVRINGLTEANAGYDGQITCK